AGGLLTYTVTVINFGPQNATGVDLTFTVSGDIADLATANLECSVGVGNSAHCLVGDLAAGTSLDIIFTCRPTTSLTGLAAMAVVGAMELDANEQNDMAQEHTIVLDQPATAEFGFPPGAHRVGAIYPNPSAGGLAFRLDLEHEDEVRIAVYDVRGRRVAVAPARRVRAGEQAVVWQPKVERGGLYFVRIETASGVRAVRRWVVLE
ncbi:MAG: T9SS type A sorting domain-containing protein, partial [Candidatus Krumholzibacteriia bacterium]